MSKLKFDLFFDEYDENGNLIGQKQFPLKFLIIANFSGREVDNKEVYEVAQSNYIDLFRTMEVEPQFRVSDYLTSNGENGFDVSIPFDNLEQFELVYILEHCPQIQKYLDFLDMVGELDLEEFHSYQFKEEELLYFKALNFEANKITHENEISRFIALGYVNVNKQANEIIYNDVLQEVEISWRSLRYLQKFVDENFKLCVLNITKEELKNDLLSHDYYFYTDLYGIIYLDGVDTFGSEPYSMALNMLQIDKKDDELIKKMCQIAREAGCPLVTDIDSDFIGLESFSDINYIEDLNDLRSLNDFQKWKEIALSDYSRFLAVIKPQIKLRNTFSETNELFYFEDNPPLHKNSGLWGTSVPIIVSPFINSFKKYRNCTAAIEANINQVEGEFDLEDVFSAKNIEKLSDFGFIVLQREIATNKIIINNAKLFRVNASQDLEFAQVKLGENLSLQLPYLMMVCNVGHYLRAIQRQSIAKSSAKELKTELNDWIRRFVTDSEMVADDILAQRPFKYANVDIIEDPNQKNSNFVLKLDLIPHIKYNGLEYNLSV